MGPPHQDSKFAEAPVPKTLLICLCVPNLRIVNGLVCSPVMELVTGFCHTYRFIKFIQAENGTTLSVISHTHG